MFRLEEEGEEKKWVDLKFQIQERIEVSVFMLCCVGVVRRKKKIMEKNLSEVGGVCESDVSSVESGVGCVLLCDCCGGVQVV